jgi:4-carboxymuconolactone decarboxylase
VLDAIDGTAGANVIESLKDVAPELGHQTVAWGIRRDLHCPSLPPRDRQLLTLGMLTALGGCEPQLEVHINAGFFKPLQQTVESIFDTFKGGGGAHRRRLAGAATWM